MDAAIVTRGLTRRFGRVTAVDGVDLVVPRGRIYGFLGPNGSGKSTTIRMLCGLLAPSAGSVEVLGHAIPRDAEALRRRVGYMTQRFSLYGDLSVRENLRFLAAAYALGRDERRTRVARALARHRLEALAPRRAEDLSGGQRQRLALAAATLHAPELLILDEPTSAVDPQTRRDFWTELFALSDAGTTILVSTHYMDEATRCHALAILDRGRLVAEGDPLALIRGLEAAAVEIDSPDPRAAHAAVTGAPGIVTVTQLGSRLHVLVTPSVIDPVGHVRALVDAAGVSGRVEHGEAGLEDVFVTRTGAAPE